MLHIVNKSHHQTTTLASCLRLARPGDALLLTEDAVLAATATAAAGSGIAAALPALKVHVLMPDAQARGVATRLLDGVGTVDYAGFVDLVAVHPVNHAWL